MEIPNFPLDFRPQDPSHTLAAATAFESAPDIRHLREALILSP
jgi:hypothetical protein